MPAARELAILISGQADKAVAALKAVGAGLGQLGGDARTADPHVKGVGDSVAGVAREAERAEPHVGRLRGALKGLGEIGMASFGIKAMVEGVAGLAQGMVAGNAEFERYETQFGVLLGSAEEAKDRLAELTEFGARTPFELPEVVRADKVLTSFGLDAKDTAARFGVSAKQIRETIGDVASGTGARFEEIAGTFGRFASGATGEAIQRFQELGIATREQMASWGLEFSKSGELLTPAREAFTVLEQHVRGKFGGMMAAQSNTFEGMMSNLSDWLGQTKRAVMAPVFDVLKDNLQGLLTFLGSDTVKGAMAGFAASMAGGVKAAVDAIGKAISIVEPIFTAFTVDAGAMGVSMERIRAIFGDTIAGAVEPFINAFMRAIPAIKEFAGALWANVQGAVVIVQRVLGGDISGALEQFQTNLGNVTGKILPILAGWGKAFLKWIAPVVPPFLVEVGKIAAALLEWVVDQVPKVARQLGTWVREFVAWVEPMVPPFLREVGKIVSALLDWITLEGPPLAKRFIGEWVPAAIGWVAQAAIDIVPKLLGLSVAIGGWIITEGVPKLVTFAVSMGGAIIDGFGQGLSALGGKIAEWIQSAINSISIDIGIFHIRGGTFWVTFPEIEWPRFSGSGDWNNSRAAGGPVWAGASFLVGERGPEIFTPSVAGHITPTQQGARTVNVTVNVTGNTVLSESQQMARDLARLLKPELDRIVGGAW